MPYYLIPGILFLLPYLSLVYNVSRLNQELIVLTDVMYVLLCQPVGVFRVSLHIDHQNILLSNILKHFNGQETHILMVNS